MLAYVLLLALTGLGNCLEIENVMPTRDEIETSINRTIEEVEKLVQENPSLPNLTRSDIVDILHNITWNDMTSIEDEAIKAIRRTRSDYQRALMVVLPYKPKDSEESLAELYTKPPMTKIVIDESKPRKESVIQAIHKVKVKADDQSASKSPETTTAAPAKTSKKNLEPQKFSFNLNEMKATPSSSIATKRPIYRGTFSRYRTSTKSPPKIEIAYAPTAEKTTTTTTTTTKKPTPTTTTTTTPQNVVSSNKWRYNPPPKSSSEKPDDSPWKPLSPSKAFFIPTSRTPTEDEPNFTTVKEEDIKKVMGTPIFVTPSGTASKATSKIIPSGFKLRSTVAPPTPMREEVQDLLKSIGLEPMKPAKLDQKINQNSVDTKLINALVEAGTKKPVKVDSSSIKKENSFENAQSPIKSGVKNLSPEIQQLFQQFGLPVSNDEQKPVVTTTTTTTTAKPRTTTPNYYTQFKPLPTSSVRDLDFRNFLARFGLTFGNRTQKSVLPRPMWKRPSLIDAVPSNMRKILENIGLIKKPKAVEQEVDIEPEASMIVEQATIPPVAFKPKAPFVEQTTIAPVVFKPKVPVVDENQNEQIKNLLQTVRMVQEGKADVMDVQKVAHELLQSTKSLENGPDPLKLEEILNNYRENLKNEVKRQQQESTTAASTTTTTTELDETTLASAVTTVSDVEVSSSTTKRDLSSSSTTSDAKTSKPSFFDSFDPFAMLNLTNPESTSTESTTTGKSNFFDTFDPEKFLKEHSNGTKAMDDSSSTNTNISDLEDSFGGSTAEPDPVVPTRPKTGLYFLVDWNSFLEVGEEGGKDRVNLRFAPKVGDRTRFLPVKIP